jgi:hypothetical protein
VAEWTWQATHAAPYPPPDGSEIPATGKTIEMAGVSVLTVRDGKLASQHEYLRQRRRQEPTRADATRMSHLSTQSTKGGAPRTRATDWPCRNCPAVMAT